VATCMHDRMGQPGARLHGLELVNSIEIRTTILQDASRHAKLAAYERELIGLVAVVKLW